MSETPVPLSTLREDPSEPGSSDIQKLTGWAKEPSVMDLKGDLESASPSQQAHMLKIIKWNDNLTITGSAKFKGRRGRSSVQPKLIRKQAEWRYCNLSEPFLSADDLFSVAPTSWEDIRPARQNELILNWQFRTKFDRVAFIDEFVRTVTDEGTVIVQVGWARETKTEKVMAPVYTYYPPADEAQLTQLQEALKVQAENPAEFLKLDEAIRESVIYSLENQQPAWAIKTGEQEVDKEKILRNEPTVEILNTGNVFIDPSCSGDISKARFIIHSFETSKADLKKQGSRYKNLRAVNWDSNSILSQPDHKTGTPDNFNFKDEARKRVVAYEYWGYYDINGTGELTSIVATWLGDIMIRMEENPFPDGRLPFVISTYMPIKKSFYGEPDGELLVDNQRIAGALTRGMIDLMARSANAQTGMAKGMLDVPNRRKYDNGDDYEYNPGANPLQGIIEHKFPEIPASAMNMLGMQNVDAESMTGVKAFSNEGISGAAFGDMAKGAQGAMTAAAERKMGILRRLAKSIAEIGSKIVAMNQEFMSDEETIRLTNETFEVINRDELKGRFDMSVKVATEESNAARAQELGFMLQTMGNNLDFNLTKMILVEIARLRKMPDLAKKIEAFEPQPDPLVQEKMQLEIEELRSKIAVNQAKVAELGAAAQMHTANAGLKGAQADKTNLDYVEQETGTTHARAVDHTKTQARSQQDLVVTKAIAERHKDVEGATPAEDIAAAIGHTQLS